LAIPDYVRLLRAGVNVVTTSTTRLVNPHAYEPAEWRDQLAAAAKQGQVSLYASGIEPGFAADCGGDMQRSPQGRGRGNDLGSRRNGRNRDARGQRGPVCRCRASGTAHFGGSAVDDSQARIRGLIWLNLPE
jgi:hypothetical protein